MKSIFTVIALLSVSLLGSAHALESGEDYFLDDNEQISLLISVDDSGKAMIEEAFLNNQLGDKEYILSIQNAKVNQVTDDHSYGKMFGLTTDGDYALVIFHINGDDVELKAKIWTDGGVERIISNGEVTPLF